MRLSDFVVYGKMTGFSIHASTHNPKMRSVSAVRLTGALCPKITFQGRSYFGEVNTKGNLCAIPICPSPLCSNTSGNLRARGMVQKYVAGFALKPAWALNMKRSGLLNYRLGGPPT